MDTGRRVLRWLPIGSVERLRQVAEWLDRQRPPPPIEDWSAPLIEMPSAPSQPPSGLLTTAGPGVIEPARPGEPAIVHTDATAPRCLLVTGLLDVGGMDEVVAFLGRRLRVHGLQTAVLHATSSPSPTGEPTGRLGRMLASSGIEVHEADEKSAPDWIKHWRPDVISAHGAPDWILPVAEQAGVPYVDNLHGMHSLFWADWQAEAKRGTKLAAIVSVSELVRQQYLAGNPAFPPKRIVTIPNGVDDERRPSGDRAAIRARLGLTEEYVFVSLARHCQQKNSYGLITAFDQVAQRRPEAHLVIAGWADQPRYYRRTLQLRDSLTCHDRIHLRDHAPAPAELLAAADGFVLDSFFEGWSLASMEALFAGLPVVLSEVGGACEQIGGSTARGYLVANPLGDPLRVDWEAVGMARYRPQVNRDEFAAAMWHLIADRDDYLANREALATESAARFSADACLAQHVAVLRAVATGSDLPSGHDAQTAAKDIVPI
jgi:glycosyltransferase involved in cell wall biosynthesis